jgi:integrase
MAQTTFTERFLSKLKRNPPPTGQKDYFEKLRRGLTLVVRNSYGGALAWRVVYYERGRPHAKTIGRYPELGVSAARKKAYAFDPKAASASAEAGSFKEVAEKWIKRHVDENKLRSKPEIERQLTKYIYPRWAHMPFFEIRRKTVIELLDKIVDEHSKGMADACLATIRSICTWHQSRDEDYVSPVVKQMKRDKRRSSERARTRILNDNEIRALWNACDQLTAEGNLFGGLVKLLLLTAQRREKVATMKWNDIVDGVWAITSQPREKGNAGDLRLPPVALKIIESQPMIDDNPYVFAGSIRGRRHGKRTGPAAFNSWSQRKQELDKKLPANMPHWTLHDLRRTARSLMARAGVTSEHAERVMGHAIAGVEGIYDRHAYFDEKADALNRLAHLVDAIINPPPPNVVSLPQERRKRR